MKNILKSYICLNYNLFQLTETQQSFVIKYLIFHLLFKILWQFKWLANLAKVCIYMCLYMYIANLYTKCKKKLRRL